MNRFARVLLVLLPVLASAQVPARLGYQGRLLGTDGSPATGTKQFAFALFSAASGGEALWIETQQLALSDGYYSASLGAKSPLSAALFAGERWLELSVDGAALAPRQPIDSVPVALVAQSLSGGPVNASSIAVANKVVIDGSGKLDPQAVGTGTIAVEKLKRGGLVTDVARGAAVTVTDGTLSGGGPTNEYATQSRWATSTFPSTMTVDLGEVHYYVDQIAFEAHWRGDTRFIPAFAGDAAYVLQHSKDGQVWSTLPAVAPIDGDIFIHGVTAVEMRFIRLTVRAPATAGNAVHISMFRALSSVHGDSTRVDARRLYGAGGAPAGRVTGTVSVACNHDSTVTATNGCNRWGTGACSGGNTTTCGTQIGCSAGVLVPVSHSMCWTQQFSSTEAFSYCHFYLCIE